MPFSGPSSEDSTPRAANRSRVSPVTATGTAELVLDAHAITAESPVWDRASDRLLWVDVHRRTVNQVNRDGTSVVLWTASAPLGFVVTAADHSLVAGAGDQIVRLRTDSVDLMWRCPDLVYGGRLNDGKCDPAGRLWAGTMTQDQRRGACAL